MIDDHAGAEYSWLLTDLTVWYFELINEGPRRSIEDDEGPDREELRVNVK